MGIGMEAFASSRDDKCPEVASRPRINPGPLIISSSKSKLRLGNFGGFSLCGCVFCFCQFCTWQCSIFQYDNVLFGTTRLCFASLCNYLHYSTYPIPACSPTNLTSSLSQMHDTDGSFNQIFPADSTCPLPVRTDCVQVIDQIRQLEQRFISRVTCGSLHSFWPECSTECSPE